MMATTYHRAALPGLVVGLFASIALRVPVIGDVALAWLNFQCHRLPERSVIAGYYMPVCARCTGIYVGLAAGSLLGIPLLRASGSARLVSSLAAIGLIGAVWLEHGLHLEFSNVGRLLTGAAFAWPLGDYVAGHVWRDGP